jgi:hypothetical protein
MIQNQRAYQLIHCHTRSRLLAGAGSPVPETCSRRDLPATRDCATPWAAG